MFETNKYINKNEDKYYICIYIYIYMYITLPSHKGKQKGYKAIITDSPYKHIMLSSPTKKCITDITMIRPNLKKKDWKDELTYNCFF